MASGPPHAGRVPGFQVPKGVGRTFVIGGSIVAGGLLSFYYSMVHRKRNEQAAGKNPYHEQVIGHLSRKMDNEQLSDLRPLRGIRARYSDIPPAFPATEHHNGHMTIAAFNNNQKLRAGGDLHPNALTTGCDGEPVSEDVDRRTLVPPPQRGRNDGSGKAYTKSPDYVKNYEKTIEGKGRASGQAIGATR